MTEPVGRRWVDPEGRLTPAERIRTINAVALTWRGPMHPQMHAELRAEYDEAVAEVAAQN